MPKTRAVYARGVLDDTVKNASLRRAVVIWINTNIELRSGLLPTQKSRSILLSIYTNQSQLSLPSLELVRIYPCMLRLLSEILPY